MIKSGTPWKTLAALGRHRAIPAPELEPG